MKTSEETPESVLLVPYPKIIFLYPTFLLAIIAAIWTHFLGKPFDPESHVAAGIGTLFLGLFAVNLVILAFDFPRTTSLTLFFFVAAVTMGLVLLFTFQPQLWPDLTAFIYKFRPEANSHFYAAIAVILGAMFAVVAVVVRFDFWEVRGNELLHHHGFLANLERLSAPNLRMEKEINDIFEFLLLRSGRLTIYTSNDRQPIVLDNVPFIDRKEAAVMRMLGALQVQVRRDDGK
jgi:membrane protein YdbS with pleckstrin-like domain